MIFYKELVEKVLVEAKYGTLLASSRISTQGSKSVTFYPKYGVSLNGTLYWIAYYNETHPLLFILINFNFGSKKFLNFCDLPCGKNHLSDALVLGVFRGDRFSLLKQCHVTKKIEIWVTKNKIANWYDGIVKWMKFMEVSIPKLPDVVKTKSYSQPSYFIEDKRLVMCSCDKNGRVWIYVVGENKLISKVQLDSVVDPWPFALYLFSQVGPSSWRSKRRIRITS